MTFSQTARMSLSDKRGCAPHRPCLVEDLESFYAASELSAHHAHVWPCSGSPLLLCSVWHACAGRQVGYDTVKRSAIFAPLCHLRTDALLVPANRPYHPVRGLSCRSVAPSPHPHAFTTLEYPRVANLTFTYTGSAKSEQHSTIDNNSRQVLGSGGGMPGQEL